MTLEPRAEERAQALLAWLTDAQCPPRVRELVEAEARRLANALPDGRAELATVRAQLDALADQQRRLVGSLQQIVRNDETHFEHHQARRWDGKTPSEAGHKGTIWLTPREIASAWLHALGQYVPQWLEAHGAVTGEVPTPAVQEPEGGQ